METPHFTPYPSPLYSRWKGSKTPFTREAIKGVLAKVMEVIEKTEKTNTMANKWGKIKTKTDKDKHDVE